MATSKPPKQNPPHVKLFHTTCRVCDRHYEGNFPMWVDLRAFTCICGERVPEPIMVDGGPLGED